MIKYIVFDMDGTVLDTLCDLRTSVNFALEKFGMPLRTLSEIRSFVGNGIPVLMQRAQPHGTDEETAKALLDTMLAHYRLHSLDKTAPYDGIIPLLTELKARGITSAIVTNKDEPAAKKLSRDFFGDLVTVTVGAKPGLLPKPDPGSVNEALRILGCSDKSQAVYVGDSEVDVKTAENSGLSFVGVTWGFRDRIVLEALGAKNIITSPGELLNLL